MLLRSCEIHTIVRIPVCYVGSNAMEKLYGKFVHEYKSEGVSIFAPMEAKANAALYSLICSR